MLVNVSQFANTRNLGFETFGILISGSNELVGKSVNKITKWDIQWIDQAVHTSMCQERKSVEMCYHHRKIGKWAMGLLDRHIYSCPPSACASNQLPQAPPPKWSTQGYSGCHGQTKCWPWGLPFAFGTCAPRYFMKELACNLLQVGHG